MQRLLAEGEDDAELRLGVAVVERFAESVAIDAD
jgi:hypothetical protein